MNEPTIQTLGRYIIHAELGKGGFATVYRATDTVLERDVALKVLKPGWTDDAKAVERFMREAKQASRLKHPNIVTIYDVSQAEGRLFIAMELVRGRSLQQIIAEDGALPWARALAILEQSAAALDYAHAEGLVHRDIKPANIILDESKLGAAVHVMLTDFGLVRGAEQASLSMGTTGGLLGTPEYIPPEIWDGEPATKASDIYALGCVAFYLLTGKVLFSATTPMAVLKRHAEGPIFPQQWPSGVPAGAEAVLRRALAKDPDQRQATAVELVVELRECERQAAHEQAAREQEAKQQEETERAAQIVLTAEAARRAEKERTQQEVERKAKEEADRQAREERERQRQAELAGQAATAEKAKQEAAERERQKQAREAAKLAEEESRRKELAVAQQKAHEEKRTPASKTESNRKWLYAAGGIIAVIVMAIVLATIKFPDGTSTPIPAKPQSTAVPAAHEQPTQPSEPRRLKIGLVADLGGIDDKSFNQSAWEGVQQAANELGADAKFIETTDPQDYQKNIAMFGDEGYDVIVTVGFTLGEATDAAAKKYPNIKFIGVDQFQIETIPGVTGLNFPEDQAGFLAGALAALMSKSGQIGAVLGTDVVPLVWRFGEGYRAGARYVNPNIAVDVVYHNDVGFDKTFADPDWGKAIASAMIDKGADVIFGAGGTTGNGALLAGAERGVPVIGADVDQFYTVPEVQQVLLTSAMKLIDLGVFNIIKDYADGKWTDGNVMGPSGLAPYHDWDSRVPANVKAKIEELTQKLQSGELQTGVPAAKQ